MPALDVEPVHQPDYVGRHPVDRVSNPTLVALPDAAMIEGDDLEPFGERSYLIPPKGSPIEMRPIDARYRAHLRRYHRFREAVKPERHA
jgi:hypothetical protein